ncbi:hypothetical protein ROTO_32200 [Roseovarius tolerans]|jgi:predicted metal-binding protein|uniref:Metal-binding protein n=1 Tax=Roseovarius tolerans TaxID=74031 RepID=A0A0L6CRS7_9RHOB|nr:DUF1636 domain-containing protein [Roseovarius tolerans]KNX40243.1 hypothetical protein ROTO_32200 [Roseovarius tolerans]
MTLHSPCEVELLVCTTCRCAVTTAPSSDEADARRDGKRLLAALEVGLPEGIVLRGVECLSNCKRGCTIVLRGSGRWTYVYGGFDPDTDCDTLRNGVEKYRDAPDGRVPWRARPEHFKRNCIARIPPLE